MDQKIPHKYMNIRIKCGYHNNITSNFFLGPHLLQVPPIHKQNGRKSKSKRNTFLATNHNSHMCCFHIMAQIHNLSITFDGIKDMDVSQSEKHSSSYACLSIVAKIRSQNSFQENPFPLWLGFKAINTLNQMKGGKGIISQKYE